MFSTKHFSKLQRQQSNSLKRVAKSLMEESTWSSLHYFSSKTQYSRGNSHKHTDDVMLIHYIDEESLTVNFCSMSFITVVFSSISAIHTCYRGRERLLHSSQCSRLTELLMPFNLHWTHGSSLLCLSQALYANKSSKMSSVVLREREKAGEKVFHGTPTLEETKEDISKCQHSLPVSMFAAGNFPSLSQDKWSAQCYSFQECQGRD